MACNTCSTCDNNGCSSTFDPSNLLFFFVALCALSGNNCENAGLNLGNLSSNELLLFFLMLALLAGNGNLFNNSSCGTC